MAHGIKLEGEKWKWGSKGCYYKTLMFWLYNK